MLRVTAGPGRDAVAGTDAYDLFVIGIASALITRDWHLSSGQLAVLNSSMLAAAFFGALVFGRYADMAGRKRVYWLVAAG
jgi:MFS transporter, PHS family, inorganic phosphate transporter